MSQIQQGIADDSVIVTGGATEATLAAFSAKTMSGLVTVPYDYVGLAYTGSNLTTVTFRLGGSGGTLVATLTLAYDGSDNLISVTKS